jgi:hypothetical protein
MLITFKTDNYASITFFGDIGLSFLKILGHSNTVPGAILADDVPEVLRRLTAAIEAAPVAEAADQPLEDGEAVSLSNRALPLIELLTAAASSGSDVLWE